MATASQDDASKCPKCKGTGEVLLLFSWTECPACEGTGILVDEDADTGEHPVVPDPTTARASSGEGSGATARCDPEDDPSYFDDGLEFDDETGDGDGDDDWYFGGSDE